MPEEKHRNQNADKRKKQRNGNADRIIHHKLVAVRIGNHGNIPDYDRRWGES